MVLRFWHVKSELLSHRPRKAKALGLWIPRPLSSPLTLQFGVLFSRQVQEHPTPSSHNGLIQHQPALLVGDVPPPRLTSTIPGSETSSHTRSSVGKRGVLGLSHIRRLPLIGSLTRAFPANRRLNWAGSARPYGAGAVLGTVTQGFAFASFRVVQLQAYSGLFSL